MQRITAKISRKQRDWATDSLKVLAMHLLKEGRSSSSCSRQTAHPRIETDVNGDGLLCITNLTDTHTHTHTSSTALKYFETETNYM